MSQKIFTFITCLMLAACNMPGAQTTSSQPQAWFDMPLPDTVVLSSSLCQVIAHGASPNGIALFELSINGAFASNIPSSDSKQTLATLTTECPALTPGKNLIEVRAQDSVGGWSNSVQTTVFLAQRDNLDATPSPLPTDTPVSVTSTFTPIPTLTPAPTLTDTPQPTGSVSLERISTNLVYIGGTNCGLTDVSFVARATAPNGIAVVVLFYRFQTGNSSTDFQSIAMNPMGGDLYERTLNPTSLLGGVIPFDAATLQYQIVIQQTDGDTSIRTLVFSDITAQACGGSSTSACAQYTDERTCIANSCNWGPISGTRTIGCQAP